jgi:hypothetical protein
MPKIDVSRRKSRQGARIRLMFSKMKIVAQRDKTGMAAPTQALSVIGCEGFIFNFLEVRHNLVNDVNDEFWLGVKKARIIAPHECG